VRGVNHHHLWEALEELSHVRRLKRYTRSNSLTSTNNTKLNKGWLHSNSNSVSYLIVNGVDENATSIPWLLCKFGHPLLQSLCRCLSCMGLFLQLAHQVVYVLARSDAAGILVDEL
jgi:hypothetical protein